MSLLLDETLENAACLYVWVTPEMLYQKNLERAKEGSEEKSQTVSTQLSLNHGVQHNVMVTDYGNDDFEYLINLFPNKNYLPIIKMIRNTMSRMECLITELTSLVILENLKINGIKNKSKKWKKL